MRSQEILAEEEKSPSDQLRHEIQNNDYLLLQKYISMDDEQLKEHQQ